MTTPARAIYEGSDATATRRFYAALSASGSQGLIAKHLLQTAKASARAKVYRGKADGGLGARYRDLAYEKKQWAMGALCQRLDAEGTLAWGWAQDAAQPMFPWVLYVVLPAIGQEPSLVGQVSFHTGHRLLGPPFPQGWDGTHRSTERILAFADAVLVQAIRAQGVLAGFDPMVLEH